MFSLRHQAEVSGRLELVSYLARRRDEVKTTVEHQS